MPLIIIPKMIVIKKTTRKQLQKLAITMSGKPSLGIKKVKNIYPQCQK